METSENVTRESQRTSGDFDEPVLAPARRRLERAFHRSVYLGVQRLRGRPVGKRMRQLAEWDGLDPQGYSALSRRRLEHMLSYAYERVPLYRTAAWTKAVAARPDELHRWPLLERGRLAEQRDALVAEHPSRPRLFPRRSSASTGTPIEVLWTLDAVAWSWAAEYHPMLWHGLEIGTRTLRMWGSAWGFENWVLNRHFVPAHDLNPRQLDQALRYIEADHPELVWGTPSAVHELARHVGRVRAAGARPAVPYVKVGGEQLYDFQRAEITGFLRTKVVESYGCTEMGPIAAECPLGARHILTANVHIEIFRDGARVEPGERGEIVATTLVNHGMPLVRCKIGDTGRISPDPCPCGRPQPVLDELQGRAADLVLRTDGTPVHGSALGRALQAYAGRPPLGTAQKVRFEQIDLRRWKVMIESHQPGDVATLSLQVTQLLRETLGSDCEAETELVPRIEREPSGKFRYYKTLVS